MPYDTGLADRIRRKGVRVIEVDGWRTRGSSTYTPLLGLWHHSAGAARGSVPSLAICIYGRHGPNPVPGPLCQVLQSREPDGNDAAYVIAAGKANHGGQGIWRGISGNSKAFGVEVEHTGTTAAPGRRHEITARIIAAGIEAGSRDARNVCRHAEYATPKGRKIDFADAAAPYTADWMRARVGYWIGREEEDVDEATLRKVIRQEVAGIPDATAKKVLDRINELGYDDDTAHGSVIRKATVELVGQGVDGQLEPGGHLSDRLDHIDDAIAAGHPDKPDTGAT